MSRSTLAWLNGFLGVLIFSASLPATRIAVAGFSPLFLTSARAVIAAVLAGLTLLALRTPRPDRAALLPLAITAFGVVLGFPLFTALALQHIESARSIVFIGLLPLSTALFGVLRGGERPGPLFWLFALLGAGCVVGFALAQSSAGAWRGDLYMVVAILLCGLGYAEGATLSRTLGGWQVISWALLLALPAMLPLLWLTWPDGGQPWPPLRDPAWLGLAYVSAFSMFIGFIFWYRGLALGGIAAVGQLQLTQPFFGLLLAGLLLGEHVSMAMLLTTVLVIGCVFGAKRYAG